MSQNNSTDQLYQITPQRQLSMLAKVLQNYIFVLIVYGMVYGSERHPVFLLCFFGYFMIWAFPAILLHIQYFFASRHTRLTVNEQERKLSFTKGTEKRDYSFDDIQHIIYVTGPGNETWYTFSDYRYFVLVFKDGKRVLVTALMMQFIWNDVEAMFGMQLEIHQILFPFIYKSIFTPSSMIRE